MESRSGQDVAIATLLRCTSLLCPCGNEAEPTIATRPAGCTHSASDTRRFPPMALRAPSGFLGRIAFPVNTARRGEHRGKSDGLLWPPPSAWAVPDLVSKC